MDTLLAPHKTTRGLPPQVPPFFYGIKWSDRIPNTVVLGGRGISGIESMLITAQFHWVGHILFMDDSRIPKRVFLGQPSTGTRSIGRLPLRCKDTLKKNLKSCKMDFGTWKALAEDRSAWRTTWYKAVHTFEETSVAELQELQMCSTKGLRFSASIYS